MLGDYTGAKADFDMVTGANRKAIAEYWVAFINHREKAAAGPIAAAPVT
jgi:hypothetical protein